jgi:PAS domain S-box-containing protein
LQDEQDRYADLFNSTPVPYAVTDNDGVIREANLALSELFGVPPAFLVGKPLAALVPLAERGDFRQRLGRAATDGRHHRWEATLEARGGREIHVELLTSAIHADELNPAGIRWVIHDISERIRAEIAIRSFAAELEERVMERTAEVEEQRSRLHAVVETMPAGLLLVDLDGRVLLANERVAEILGHPDWGGDEWEGYGMDGRRYEQDEFPLARTLRTGESVDNERIELVVSGGSRVVVDVASAPLRDSSGALAGGLVLLQDVTVQERQERAEREFVTNAAHELQSPLASIVSAVEVLQSGAKTEPQRDVFLGHIERESDRLTRLVRALLILARTQTGVEAPRDELVGLAALLGEVREGLRAPSGVEVVVDCPEHLAVVTNRELVEQAVVNLAENAAKHTTTGRIVLGAREVPQGVVELSVSDTGGGIPASERPRVFERFYRADANGSVGFGLGLAIVRAVADALQGELELDSTVGSGTTIRLRLLRAASLVSR